MSPNAAIEFPALRDERFPVHARASEIEPYLRAIVEQIHPNKIILFGSQAYGTPTRHSDFDLLIVREGITSMKESNMEIRRLFWHVNAPPLSFTLLSNTPEEVEEKLRQGSPIYRDILYKGLLLYAA